MATFEVGRMYNTRWAGDSQLTITCLIAGRTAKTVKALVDGKIKSYKLHIRNNEEFFFPEGRFSKAPVMSASKIAGGM